MGQHAGNLESIKVWLAKAQKKGARYLVVGHDAFDMGDFPIYVMPNQNFWERCPYPKFGNTTKLIYSIHEVYDMELNIEKQLEEEVAWHPPSKSA